MDTKRSDTVDYSHRIFCELLEKLKCGVGTINSEQDTRIKIIDPIFINPF